MALEDLEGKQAVMMHITTLKFNGVRPDIMMQLSLPKSIRNTSDNKKKTLTLLAQNAMRKKIPCFISTQ